MALYATFVDLAVLGAAVVVSALAGLVGLTVRLADRRRVHKGRDGLEETLVVYLAASTPSVRASAAVGFIGLVWRLSSWTFQIGDPGASEHAWLGLVEPTAARIDGLALTAMLGLVHAGFAMALTNEEDLVEAKERVARKKAASEAAVGSAEAVRS